MEFYSIHLWKSIIWIYFSCCVNRRFLWKTSKNFQREILQKFLIVLNSKNFKNFNFAISWKLFRNCHGIFKDVPQNMQSNLNKTKLLFEWFVWFENILFWLNQLSKSESVKFSLIESVICLFTDSSVKKYFSLSNQLIFTDWINKKNVFHC